MVMVPGLHLYQLKNLMCLASVNLVSFLLSGGLLYLGLLLCFTLTLLPLHFELPALPCTYALAALRPASGPKSNFSRIRELIFFPHLAIESGRIGAPSHLRSYSRQSIEMVIDLKIKVFLIMISLLSPC